MENYEKKYKEALEKARQLCVYPTTKPFISDLQDLFPELAESGGEKIRKEIITYLSTVDDKELIPYESWIAWLEKQGERPINKVEPKFKDGDWIVIDDETLHIKLVRKDGYLTDEEGFMPFQYEERAHLWTIQDAKDGDVLYECNEKNPFIFKELKTKHIGDIASYCDIFNDVFNPNEDNWTTLDIIPATKKQRDLLFQKMKEAGYEFDFEKKELKKIEQKPVEWSEEDSKWAEEIRLALRFYSKDKPFVDKLTAWFNNHIQSQPKQGWSEEDKTMIESLTALCDDKIKTTEFADVKEHAEKCKHWLKSIKDRCCNMSHWKPTKEQITWLYRAADMSDKDSRMKQVLNELLEQLKAL